MKVVFGATDHRTIDTMTNLAITCFNQGKYREALLLNMQSLEMEKNVKGMVPISIIIPNTTISIVPISIIIIPIIILNLILDCYLNNLKERITMTLF